jgi:hypothetical protein
MTVHDVSLNYIYISSTWARQCHKPIPFRDAKLTTHQTCDDLGVVYFIFGFQTWYHDTGNRGPNRPKSLACEAQNILNMKKTLMLLSWISCLMSCSVAENFAVGIISTEMDSFESIDQTTIFWRLSQDNTGLGVQLGDQRNLVCCRGLGLPGMGIPNV